MRSIKSLGGLTRGRGMDKSTQNIWISTLHDYTAIEQHVELGKSRHVQDNQDLQKLYSWLQQFNPFDLHNCKLRSLKSSLVAKESERINCYQPEIIK